MRRSRKPKGKDIRAGSQRRADIRADIEPYIDSLVRLYERTDPALGPKSEEDKLEMARQAVSIWWYLYGELLLWAQSHLAGCEFVKGNPEFVDLVNKNFGVEITEDAHVLE